MNKKKTWPIAWLLAAWLLLPKPCLQAEHSVSERTIAMGNVIGCSVSTLARGLIQGKVHGLKDAARLLAYGAASGYGFYHAKKQAAAGHALAGLLLTNLSASVVDNISSGEGPLSYLGFPLPLFCLRVATPLARRPGALLNFAFSPRDLINLLQALGKSDRVMLRDGLLAFEANHPLQWNVRGWTYGIYPTVVKGKPGSVFRHETVHVLQGLQLIALSPEPFLKGHRRREGSMKIVSFCGFRLHSLALANDLVLTLLLPHEKNWKEVEARSLVVPE